MGNTKDTLFQREQSLKFSKKKPKSTFGAFHEHPLKHKSRFPVTRNQQKQSSIFLSITSKIRRREVFIGAICYAIYRHQNIDINRCTVTEDSTNLHEGTGSEELVPRGMLYPRRLNARQRSKTKDKRMYHSFTLPLYQNESKIIQLEMQHMILAVRPTV